MERSKSKHLRYDNNDDGDNDGDAHGDNEDDDGEDGDDDCCMNFRSLPAAAR
mgnify:CR=1 FL=1